MARCQCGGTGCNCVIVAGDGVEVVGAGSTPNPYVVSAVTNCSEVRNCLSSGAGISFDQATGVISAVVSPEAGNNLVLRPGGLFVPTGAATVEVGCGLAGDGSGSDPVRVAGAAWPYACDLSANGGGVYCDPATGELRTDPPFRSAYAAVSPNDVLDAPVAVPATETVVETYTVTITNPDPCRPAFAIVLRSVDVEFDLPAGGGSAAAGINTDDLNYMRNTGSTGMASWHSQNTVFHNDIIAAGGSQTIRLDVTVGRGAGGATYDRIQATIRVWLFSIPQN